MRLFLALVAFLSAQNILATSLDQGKDELGFSRNLSLAIAEAKITHKPLLIDFFAIWCPPCNLYDERVFASPEFLKIASQFVLLKMDADDSASFELKSHFHVGGYPTIVIASATSGGVSGLKEINRVIGFREPLQFREILEQSLVTQDPKYEARRTIQLFRNTDNWSRAFMTATLASTMHPDDTYFALVKAQIEAELDPYSLQTRENLLKHSLENYSNESSASLDVVQDLLVSHAEVFPKSMLKGLSVVYDELERREDANAHAIAGVDISNADLDWKRIAFAKALGDKVLQKQVTTRGIARLRALLSQFPARDSRAIKLELADMLGDNGEFAEARAIYDKMIATYPNEFTFYFAAAKNMLKANDAASAKHYNDIALQYAYGDNLIRASERQIRILTALGQIDQAQAFGRDFLVNHPQTSLEVRTNKYLQKLTTAINDAKLAH